MIFDVLLLAFFAGLIWLHARRGAVRSLATMLTAALSCFLATIIGRILAIDFYRWFVEPAIDKAVANAIENVKGDICEKIAEALPSWVTLLLGKKADNLEELFAVPISSSQDVIIEAVNKGVYPVVIALMTFFITVLLFFTFLLLTRRFLMYPLMKLFHLPLTEKADKILGGVIGFFEALIIVCMTAFLLHMILSVISLNSSWLNEENINKSFMFKLFYSGNIFTWVDTLVTG